MPLQRAQPKSLSVRFLERGPLVVCAEVTYTFDRPDLSYGTKLLIPGGTGHYAARITLSAAQPSILIEEDTDTDVAYELDFYAVTKPNQARYQGHHSTSKQAGYEQDGRQYRMWHERTNCDALVDLQYQMPWETRFLARWDPWIYDSGWYWQWYNTQDGSSGPLVGIFAGRACARWAPPGAACKSSRVLRATDAHRRRASAWSAIGGLPTRVYSRTCVSSGACSSARGELAPPNQVQEICRQMNLHAGFNLNKVHRYALEYPDPPQGYGGMFMPRDARERLLAKLQADKSGPHGRGFHHYLYTQDPYARPLVDFWFDPSPERVQRVSDDVAALAENMLDAFVNGQGIMDFRFHYWHGGLQLTGMATWIDQLLASPATSAEQRARPKRRPRCSPTSCGTTISYRCSRDTG